MNWLGALARHEQDGTACVLVTVLAARGSTPREAGAKMVVTNAGQDGSIGGGRLEHACAEMARTLLRDPPDAPLTRDFPLGPALGQCCGGHATVLFEAMRPSVAVAIFGAGHVGQALVRFLGEASCRVRWIDSRAEAFPAELPGNVTRAWVGEPEREVEALAPATMVLVMTHDHGLDYRLIAACLRRGDLRFVGLIGSATKRARFASRLRAQGLSDATLVCPIGVPGIGGKWPAEIALSVAAQVLQVRDAAGATPSPRPSPRGEREKNAPSPLGERAGERGGCTACRMEVQ